MKTPTLEEVKEYFKNAKEVRCIWDERIYDISDLQIFEEKTGRGHSNFYATKSADLYPHSVGNYVGLIGLDKEYAEIVSQIQPEPIPNDVIKSVEKYRKDKTLTLIEKI